MFGLPKIVLFGLALVLLLGWLFVGHDDQINDSDLDDSPVLVAQELKLPALSDADYDWIAARIYQNEAQGQSRFLTYWGEGEDFPSFGIGHFIWFPAGVDAPFDEMFPHMVASVRRANQDSPPLPIWMRELAPFAAPWVTKLQFDQALSSPEMNELRDWLEASAQMQARFIVATFEQRWRQLSLPADQKQAMTVLLQSLAESAGGLFAIIDYYNFKGLGDNPRERYQGQGWGLIQVLHAMQILQDDAGQSDRLVELFRQAASERLSLRVELSPPERNEARWLNGWFARLDGYLEQGNP